MEKVGLDEIWKTVDGYDALEVSNVGRVRTLDSIRSSFRMGRPNQQLKKGGVMSPFLGNHGYLHVAPKIGKQRKKLLVHRLVAKAFVHGFFEKASVNHIDGNKLNNRVENLEWITLAENTAHQWKIGLIDLRGEKHPSAKLKDADVEEIQRMVTEGCPIHQIATQFSVSQTLIYKIKNGQKRTTRPIA
jgi:hypothetical protein